MKIDITKCTGCKQCMVYCPGRAIKARDGKAYVDEVKCVECGSCYRLKVCPNDAIQAETELPWPRSMRSILSDPLTEFKETGVTGRGTEEMKTNDVTNRFEFGEVGFAIDVGRPVLGTTVREIEKIAMALASIGIQFEPKNPITFLMEDPRTGKMRADVLDERFMSGIIEFKAAEERMSEVLTVLKEVSKKVDTVFSVGVISRVADDGSISALCKLTRAGWEVRPNGKTNMGLGRLC